MLSLFIIIAVTFSLAHTSYAQPTINWREIYGGDRNEYGNSLQETPDGGIAVTGVTSSLGPGSGDVFLLKTSETGNIQWVQTYGGLERDFGQCIQVLDDGGFIIAGYTESYGAGSEDVYLIRTDSIGDTIWTRTFGGNDWEKGRSVVATDDGGFLAVGTTLSFGAGRSDIYLMRLDENGDSLWTTTYGFEGYEKGYCIRKTNDDGFVISGYTNSYGFGSADVLLLKIDSYGNVLWTNNFGGDDFEEGICVRLSSDYGYIICGRTNSFGPESDDVYVIRTDENGDSLWTMTYGGTIGDEGFSIVETDNGGFIITGKTESSGAGGYDVLLMKIDENGNVLWNTAYGGDGYDWGMCLEKKSGGGYIVIGTTNSFGQGSFNVFLMDFVEETGEKVISGINNYAKDANFSISPNPFNQSTVIDFVLLSAGNIRLAVYDIQGCEVARLMEGYRTAGTHQVIFNAKNLASGMYFARLTAGDFQQTRKLILIK